MLIGKSVDVYAQRLYWLLLERFNAQQPTELRRSLYEQIALRVHRPDVLTIERSLSEYR